MFNIVLYEPEIPSNTGNLIRLCANTGSKLHLIEPLGFSLENRNLRRAGLDYRDLTPVQVHDSFASCRKSIEGDGQLVTFSTHHSKVFSEFQYKPTDIFLFGSETKGLPQDLLEAADDTARLTIPMLSESRSLNLSNAVSIVVYEAWRQVQYTGARPL